VSSEQAASSRFEKSAERPTAFLSYAREDRPFVRRFADALIAKSNDVRADWQITPGERYAEALRTFILSADAFVFVISPDSAASAECKSEIAIAVEHQKRILPVWYRDHGDDNRLDSAIRTPQWTAIADGDGFDAGVESVCAALRTDFDLMDQHARLLLGADQWAKSSKRRGYLLHEEELTAAEEWLKRTSDHPEKAPQPTPLELEFIFASQADRQRRGRRAMMIASAVAIVLVILAVAAVAQSIRATAERDRAMSRALAASALSQLSTDVELSLLLGIEAARVAPTVEAEDAIRQAMVEARRVPLDSPGELLTATSAVDGTAFSSDRSVTVSPSGSVATVGSTTTSQRPTRELKGHWDDITSVAVSPDAHFAATGAQDKTARLWDLRTAEMLAVFLHPNQVSRVAFSTDGDYILTSAGFPPPGTPFAAWETKTGRVLAQLPGRGSVQQLSYTPDGAALLVVSSDRTVRVWDPRSTNTWTLPGQSADWSPDGRALVVADGVHAALWRVTDRTKRAELPDHHRVAIARVRFSPNGRTIVTAAADGTAAIWQSATASLVADLPGHGTAIEAVAFSKDGAAVATGGRDHKARISDTADGRAGPVLQGHTSSVLSIAFSADGRSLLTASDDHAARLWNRDGTQRAELRHPDEGVKAVFSPDGSLVATGSEASFAAGADRAIAALELWDGQSGRHLSTLRGHTDVITSLAFSPDGRWLLSTSQDQSARIWDVRSGRQLAAYRRHSGLGGVRTATFGPRNTIATASGDGVVRLYRCEPCAPLEELVSWAQRRVSRPLTADERARYLR
jgi:WD40 repeat protein